MCLINIKLNKNSKHHYYFTFSTSPLGLDSGWQRKTILTISHLVWYLHNFLNLVSLPCNLNPSLLSLTFLTLLQGTRLKRGRKAAAEASRQPPSLPSHIIHWKSVYLPSITPRPQIRDAGHVCSPEQPFTEFPPAHETGCLYHTDINWASPWSYASPKCFLSGLEKFPGKHILLSRRQPRS